MPKKDTLVCLKKIQNGVVCYNSTFQVKRSENGLIAICTYCGAEHVVRYKNGGLRMKNDYKIVGDKTVIYLPRRNGDILETVIDTHDLPLVDSFPNTWCASYNKDIKSYYAKGWLKQENGKQKMVYLHRWIMQAKKGQYVDHINHDTLLNTRENLRCVTNAENGRNRKGPQSNNSTGVLNVTWNKQKKKYQVKVQINGKTVHFGFYKNLSEAEKVSAEIRANEYQKIDRVRSSTGVRYIYWNKQRGKYQIKLWIDGKEKHFGFFDTLEKAKRRLDEVMKEMCVAK